MRGALNGAEVRGAFRAPVVDEAKSLDDLGKRTSARSAAA